MTELSPDDRGQEAPETMPVKPDSKPPQGAETFAPSGTPPQAAGPASNLPRQRIAERVARRLEQAPDPDALPSMMSMGERWPSRRAMRMGGGVVALLMVCLTVTAVVWAWNRVRPEPELSQTGAGVTQAADPLTPQSEDSPAAAAASESELPPGEAQPVAVENMALPPADPGEVEQEVVVSGGGLGQFALFYDSGSFYIMNQSGLDVPVANFAFELVSAEGSPLTRVDGSYWSEIYPRFREGYCLSMVQYGNSNPLSPAECEKRLLVFRSPTKEQDMYFWVGRDGATQFRVLWQDQVVGLCPVDSGPCIINLP